MYAYSIMDLHLDHIDEIINDIKNQYEKGVSKCVLFSFLLVPEGIPCADKVGEYLRKYKIFSDKLNEMGLKCGVLVQSTIGHGGALVPTAFGKYVNLTDGTEMLNPCPLDEDFKQYLKDAFCRIAKHNPEIIMLDDDFRLIGRSGKGCACKKHIAEFEKRIGKKYTREKLWEIIETNPEGCEAKIFREVQKDSLINLAKEMRSAIDSVNPDIQGAFCCVGNWTEFGADIAKIMSGKGNKIILRIHNGNYTPQGARHISKYAYRAAAQINMVKDKVDVILAETDTCPRNRYSTGAQSLHSHFTSTILEGAHGAKHFLTTRLYEPKSGVAYRKILAKNAKFYEELIKIVPKLKWKGAKMPLTKFNEYAYYNHGWDGTDNWSTYVLERMGIPVFFADNSEGCAFLTDEADRKFSDEKILNLLKGTLVLTSESAQSLIKRGFGKYLGVDVREWEGKVPTREFYEGTTDVSPAQFEIKELVPLSDDVKIDSKVYNSLDLKTYTYLFPGTTIFKNELGGTVIVFCGTVSKEFHYAKAFSYLNESRKRQFVRLLKETGNLPVYYDSDEEVYLKCAQYENDKLFVAMFNMGFDIIEEINLKTDKNVEKVEMLMPDGTYKMCNFEKTDSGICVKEMMYTLNPVVLILG